MKKFLITILAFLAFLVSVKGQSTNGVQLPITIPAVFNIFTNFPDTTPNLASFGVSAGALTLSGNLENYVGASLNLGSGTNFWTRFSLGGEIYNGPASTIIDAADLELGFRAMIDQNYEVTLGGFGRKYFANIGDIEPGYTGGFYGEFNWRILSGNNLYTQTRYEIESPNHSGGRFDQTLKFGFKFYFPGF